ncbi:receptor L domain-containing protein [Paraliomyxa miuraensis]|uniref:hypothetical protein n=1 Tax=Paraliomyxa miuraensis TaxID=376150 RepID=UPI00224DA034|nr:hypothetical protein [Paraliomyxa miuraensis]MCX4245780.1 hypothetical protein [Paraliomyxa miuraensis]
MSALLAAPLCLAGCPSDDTGETGANDSSTGEPGTTTTETPTTTGVDSSTTDEPTTTGAEELYPSCGDPTLSEIPPAPVDCAGVDGVLMGSVIIEDGGDDPSALDGIREVTGAVRINRTDLTNLDFMACLTTVGEDVTIFDNDSLTDVSGLWSLTDIGTDFIFSGNDALTELHGPPNVERIIGNIVIRDNASLERLRGWQTLIGLEGYTFINEDGEEEFAGGNLTIQLNPVARDMAGFCGLLVVNGVFAVTNNPMLCLGSVADVGEGIVQPAEPPDSWSISGSDPSC